MNSFGHPNNLYWTYGSYSLSPYFLQAEYAYQTWNAMQGKCLESFAASPENQALNVEGLIPAALENQGIVKTEAGSNTLNMHLPKRTDDRNLKLEIVKMEEVHHSQKPPEILKRDPYSELGIARDSLGHLQKYQENQQADDPKDNWEPDIESMEANELRFRRDRHDRALPNELAVEQFKNILKSAPQTTPSAELVKIYKKQLEGDLQKEAKNSEDREAYVVRETDMSRKNITQKYLRLFRLIFRLLSKDLAREHNLEDLKERLSRSGATISTVMKIYREPSFQFFVDFLRKEILTEQRFPKFIIALPMKPAEKLVMLGGMDGMILAVNNPHISLGSWYLNPKELAGDTSHIIQAVQERQIGIGEVVELLKHVYEKVARGQKPPRFSCRYSSIASRFSTIIQQAIKEASALRILKKHELTELRKIYKRTCKSSSITSIKEMLAFESLRSFLNTEFINNSRLIVQVLRDPCLNYRTKLGILESYESFAKATMDPNSLHKWH